PLFSTTVARVSSTLKAPLNRHCFKRISEKSPQGTNKKAVCCIQRTEQGKNNDLDPERRRIDSMQPLQGLGRCFGLIPRVEYDRRLSYSSLSGTFHRLSMHRSLSRNKRHKTRGFSFSAIIFTVSWLISTTRYILLRPLVYRLRSMNMLKMLMSLLGSQVEAALDKEVKSRLKRLPNKLNEFNYDAWGFHPETAQFGMTLSVWLYKYYWRAEVFGVEKVPEGRVLLIANHSGQLPIDGMLICVAML